MKILKEIKTRSSLSSQFLEKDLSDESSQPSQQNKRIKLDVYAFIKGQEITFSEGNEKEDIEKEFYSYLREPVVVENIDVFEWWKIFRVRYPNIFL